MDESVRLLISGAERATWADHMGSQRELSLRLEVLLMYPILMVVRVGEEWLAILMA
jgi:hypothetical protein